MIGGTPKSISMALFGNLTGAAVLYCLFSGVRATADCLSEEKREGTLGLLFLTDLKGYDVVLGKLAGTSLNALYSLLAVVPLLAVPLLLGGITVGEFYRMAIVAIDTLLFSLSIGICVSSMSRSARKAVTVTFLLLITFAAVLPAIGSFLAYALKKPHLDQPFFVLSPGFSFYKAFAASYKAEPKMFWWSITLTHGLSWFLLGLSAFIAPRSWQDKPPGAQTLRWRELWKSWSYGDSRQRQAFRKRLLNTNAFYWLAGRARLKPTLVWAAFGLLACGWTWGLVKYKRDWLNGGVYFITALVLNILIKSWFGSEAGRQLAEDRKHGALELLLSTPLTVSEILRGQRLALQRQFLWPIIAVISVFVIIMIATPRTDDFRGGLEWSSWVMLWLAGTGMLIADLIALYWVGMWQAISSKHPNRAASATVARVLVLPWLAFLLISLALSFTVSNQIHEPGNFFLTLWFGLGLAADIGFGGWARHKLLSEFRLAAAQRSSSRQSLFQSLFGQGGSAVQLQPASTDTIM